MYKHIYAQLRAALLSGKYPKGRGCLREVIMVEENKVVITGHCCLGVLCNLHALAHPEVARVQTEPDRYLGSRNYLPTKVQAWAGMHSSNGNWAPHPTSSLIYINDHLTTKDFIPVVKALDAHWREL